MPLLIKEYFSDVINVEAADTIFGINIDLFNKYFLVNLNNLKEE